MTPSGKFWTQLKRTIRTISYCTNNNTNDQGILNSTVLHIQHFYKKNLSSNCDLISQETKTSKLFSYFSIYLYISFSYLLYCLKKKKQCGWMWWQITEITSFDLHGTVHTQNGACGQRVSAHSFSKLYFDLKLKILELIVAIFFLCVQISSTVKCTMLISASFAEKLQLHSNICSVRSL